MHHEHKPFKLNSRVVAEAIGVTLSEADVILAEITPDERDLIDEGYARGGHDLAMARLRHILDNAAL